MLILGNITHYQKKSNEMLENILNIEKKDELYFALQNYFKKIYGKNSVIFMQNGNKYYLYQNLDKEMENIKDITKLLNLYTTKNKNILYASFDVADIKRNIQRILEQKKYTLITIKQKNNKNYISQILSSGINLEYPLDEEDNYITSIVIKKQNNCFIAGYTCIDVSTGKSFISQINSTPKDPNFALDEIMHLLNIYKTSEIVITFLEQTKQDLLLEYLEIPQNYHYHINTEIPDTNTQNKLLQKGFDIHSLLSPLEHLDLHNKTECAISTSVLIDFISKHDPDISTKINIPKIIDKKNYMYLGNNPLEQLGVISKDDKNFTLLKMLDQTITPIGKRTLRQRLLNPITNKKELNRRYKLIHRITSHVNTIGDILTNIFDLERLLRKLKLNKASDDEIKNIQKSILHVKELYGYIKKHKITKTPFNDDDLDMFLIDIKNGIDMHLLVEKRYEVLFEKIIEYIADIDVALSSSKVATKYNHSKPMIIDTKNDENFLSIMQLRHPLIEIQENTLYVPNDIVMGKRDYLDLPHPNTVMLDVDVHDGHDIDGVLLYGINASGKSSLMKSIGLCVLMAQSGFFVSASSMHFSILNSLFTRIVSNDNISKGLSTFGVEMVEMKNIFNRVEIKSLVIGDEISHGTETLSGVAIVASSIIKLAKTKCLFLFATHLHQLSTMPEITKLSNVTNLHLSVKYEQDKDRLLFFRVLQGGSGSSIYGLEFARYLHMDKEFLEMANKIREKLADDVEKTKVFGDKKKRGKLSVSTHTQPKGKTLLDLDF